MLWDPSASDSTQAATAQQDSLRPLRMFVGALQGVIASDQSYAGQDGSVINPPGQFLSYGPLGASVEGQPVAVTGGGGLVISPQLVLIGIGVAVALLWKKHGG